MIFFALDHFCPTSPSRLIVAIDGVVLVASVAPTYLSVACSDIADCPPLSLDLLVVAIDVNINAMMNAMTEINMNLTMFLRR
jgi:hypothetical protein